MKLTDTQRRILEDFADLNLATRHSRSTTQEWSQERGMLLELGFIAAGSAQAGMAHYITEAGRAALCDSRIEIAPSLAKGR